MDFGYSLGVLHHVQYAPLVIAIKLKSGVLSFFYLYYALDNRPLFSTYMENFRHA